MVSPKVLIIDNDSRFREPAAYALQQAGYRIQEAGSEQEGLRQLRQQPFDLVLLELSAACGDGIALMRQIRKRWPNVDLAIITACASLNTAIAALRCRAVDYLCKPLNNSEVLTCVEQILSERASRAPQTPTANGQFKVDEINLFFNSEQGFGLSRREYEILILILNGLSNRKIAQQLNISINTVKTHIRNLYCKMEVSSRREALALIKKLEIAH